MADTLPTPDPMAFDRFIRAQGKALRASDRAPRTGKEWKDRRAVLRAHMLKAMGAFPEKPCDLEPRIHKTLKRDGYRIELVTFQSQPGVIVTGTVYSPTKLSGKAPAVLCVHGHFRGARRDPVIQARCLGLVKLGFVVLAVDAFGAGERFTEPASGTYHGAFYGSSLWPVGQTLLGMQVYDNRRAVDYLCSRADVDPQRLGITGASGGGNQTMNAGAMDDRLKAVVPVCSVGNYQAYLHAACCVCEVLPGALQFTEEGDVLGLVAPRALMVINASRDGIQFSIAEARKSMARAGQIYKLTNNEKKLKHATFESGHGYHQPMREAMYGWMTLWLKGEGRGEPIAEPKHTVEKPEDLACRQADERAKTLLTPPAFSAQQGRAIVAQHNKQTLKHTEDWESTAVYRRAQLRKQIFGDFPFPKRPQAKLDKAEIKENVSTRTVWLEPEPQLPMPVTLQNGPLPRQAPPCVLLHLNGREAALQHPVAKELIKQKWHVLAPTLRATGEMKPKRNRVRNAVDHNSTEHSLWIGRPLLGQWVVDLRNLLDWIAIQPHMDRQRLAVIGIGTAGIVALSAGALLESQIRSIACLDMTTTYVTEEPYDPSAMQMSLLAPGLLQVGDIPHLAALSAPAPLQIVNGMSPTGEAVTEAKLKKEYAFTSKVYGLYKATKKLQIIKERSHADVVKAL